MNADSFLKSVDAFFALLEEREIEYVLVGGAALSTYVEGRNTQGVDVIMAPASLIKLLELEIIGQDAYLTYTRLGELEINVLFTLTPLFEEVRRNHSTIKHFRERDIRCATVEGLLLLKMYALPSLYRQGNLARVGLYESDIAVLIHGYRPEVEPLLDELARHLDRSDLEEVHAIVAEIQERIQRFRRISGK